MSPEMARDEAAAGRFVEDFAAVMVESGMPRIAARVFAYLLAAEEASATAAELAERLQVSPAAVSGAVRYLIQVRLVFRDRVPGQRRDTYRVGNDLWYEVLGTRDQEIVRWADLTRRGAASVGLDTAAGRRLSETSEFFDFLRVELQEVTRRWKEQQGR
ncbi:MAG: GbsR/MarR family transcriptional regulator [Nocardioidaceae bacterium]